jgi:hypothetical protein
VGGTCPWPGPTCCKAAPTSPPVCMRVLRKLPRSIAVPAGQHGLGALCVLLCVAGSCGDRHNAKAQPLPLSRFGAGAGLPCVVVCPERVRTVWCVAPVRAALVPSRQLLRTLASATTPQAHSQDGAPHLPPTNLCTHPIHTTQGRRSDCRLRSGRRPAVLCSRLVLQWCGRMRGGHMRQGLPA